jgi:putative transposase
VAEVCRRHGLSTATFQAWKARFGGLEGEPQANEAKRLKALGEETAKLERLDADAMLDNGPLSALGPRTMARALKDLLAEKW